ncbi:MAG: glycosyltransferase [Elusimicrobia bacterium]|nr:glycosyltransferase [Elusimicrobiota bacterium]
MSVSVVILGTRRAALRRCLDSLAAAGEPAPAEVIVVLNGTWDVTPADLEPYRRSLAPTVLAMPAAPLGRARNAALRLARGEILFFLDDDARVPPGFFASLADKVRAYPDAAVLGGPNLTPEDSGRFQRWAGGVLASAVGAGPMRRRYAGFARDVWTDDSALMLCNLAVRRSVLVEERLAFPEDLDRNEENLLLERLRRRGRAALHSPALAVRHDRRAGPRAFLRQCALSGLGRGQMTRSLPASLRPVHAAPAAMAVAFAASAVWAPGLAVLLSGGYAAAVLASGWTSGGAVLDRAGVAALTPAAHLAYAAGFLAGLAGARQ